MIGCRMKPSADVVFSNTYGENSSARSDLVLVAAVRGCALAQSAPGFPSRPWHAAEEQRVEADARNFHDSRFNIDPTKTYSLAELLDLAEAHNPETRVAWERARAQAAALGVEHSEVYPTLAAVVLSGTGRSNVLVGNEFFPQTIQNFEVGLDLNYTVFDFGTRSGRIDAARAKTAGG